MALVVLAVAMGINAQSSQQYRADIPFSFEARGRQHPAGEYRVGSMSINSPGAIGLGELQSGKVSILGVTTGRGNDNWDKPGTLTFVKVNGEYILSEISTATFSMKVKRAKSKVRDDDKLAANETKVKINLN